MIDPRINEAMELLQGVKADGEENFNKAIDGITDPKIRKQMIESMEQAKKGELDVNKFAEIIKGFSK